jgi:hypothetical protein
VKKGCQLLGLYQLSADTFTLRGKKIGLSRLRGVEGNPFPQWRKQMDLVLEIKPHHLTGLTVFHSRGWGGVGQESTLPSNEAGTGEAAGTSCWKNMVLLWAGSVAQ